MEKEVPEKKRLAKKDVAKKRAAKKKVGRKKIAAKKKSVEQLVLDGDNGKPKEGVKVEGGGKDNGKEKGRKPRPGQELYPMRVKGTLFYKMKAYASEVEALRTRVQLLNNEIRHEQAKPVYGPLLSLTKSRDELQRSLGQSMNVFSEVQKEVAKKFKIPTEEIGNYSFDTESGVLMPPGPPPKNPEG